MQASGNMRNSLWHEASADRVLMHEMKFIYSIAVRISKKRDFCDRQEFLSIAVPLLEISIDRFKIWPLAGKIRQNSQASKLTGACTRCPKQTGAAAPFAPALTGPYIDTKSVCPYVCPSYQVLSPSRPHPPKVTETKIFAKQGKAMLCVYDFKTTLQSFITSPSQSKAFVFIGIPRMYPLGGYFLVKKYDASLIISQKQDPRNRFELIGSRLNSKFSKIHGFK